jgi:hypothetical protein
LASAVGTALRPGTPGRKILGSIQFFGSFRVAELQHSLGLTQNEFAAKFCISLGTLRHSERGDRKPRGPALPIGKTDRKINPGAIPVRRVEAPGSGMEHDPDCA